MQLWNKLDEERTYQFKNGAERGDDSQNMIRSMLQTIERKVEEEVALRQRDQQDIKNQVEQKLISLVEKIKLDEK